MIELWKSAMFGFYIFIFVLILEKIFFWKKNTLSAQMDRIRNMGKQAEEEKQNRETQRNRVRKKAWTGILSQIQKTLDGAGIALSAWEYMGIWLLAAVLSPPAVYMGTGNMGLTGVALAGGVILPPFTVARIRKKRLSRFTSQLGDALSTVGNCLRSGFSIRQALERIATDMPDPIAAEFKAAVMEMNYGAVLEDTMLDMAVRMENKDLELLSSAISIQQRAGGNLSEIIDNVADTIRDRIRIRLTLKTLTAQGRISGLILGCLPVVALIGMTIMSPDYTSMFYTTSFGRRALLLSVCMEAAGLFAVMKIVNIKI